MDYKKPYRSVRDFMEDKTKYRDGKDFRDDCAVALSDGMKVASIPLYLSRDGGVGTIFLGTGFACDTVLDSVESDHTHFRSLPGIKQYHDFVAEYLIEDLNEDVDS